MFDPGDEIPELDLSEQRLAQVLGDIKRNSRNRRIAMVAPILLAAAVLGALLAAPPQHGGLALVADADTPDPQLPRVFGSNGVWRLAEPIETNPNADPGPASVVEAPTEPAAPSFTLSPPDQEELNSLPTSTSTPPTSTSGQSPDGATDLGEPADVDLPDPVERADVADDPAQLDWSAFSAVIRIETSESEPTDDAAADASADAAADSVEGADDTVTSSTPDTSTDAATAAAEDTTTPDNSSTDEDVTVAVEPQTETTDQTEANPSTPTDDPADSGEPANELATIVPQSVLVYSAHVSVTVQVVDDDSSVVDWCNTRVDWGDGSVSRAAGADDADLCTASCEYESTSSAASVSATGITETIRFEHDYATTIDASPRIFVATGDGCSYTLAELQLPPFTVVPLP